MSTQTMSSGAIVAGRYLIVSQLGEGGMGTVYRATQHPLGREVALKVMSPALSKDQDAIARFQREATASSSLSHPNIVTVFDFGDDNGVLFLAMELIPGTGLDGVLTQGAMPWRRAVGILRGICAALAEAHAKGIIHRDLKPANVIITSTATQSDIPKVVDFGIAKLKDSAAKNLTMTGAVVGTPGYVAPELFHGIEPSSQADLYALGVLAFDMLCGCSPFKGNTAAELLKQHLFDQPPLPSSVREGLPAGLDTLVLALLEKDPSRRPASALAVDHALAAVLDATPVAITPLSSSRPSEIAPPVTPTPSTRANLGVLPPAPKQGVRNALLSGGALLLVVVTLLGLSARKERRDNQVGADVAPLVAAPLVAAVVAPAVTPSPAIVASTSALTAPVAELSALEKPDKKKRKPTAPTTAASAPTPGAAVVAAPVVASSTPTKRAYLGTVPDQRYRGQGVRVESVTRASPAARAALAPMDILLRIDNDVVDGVPGLAVAMARHQPGDRVRVTFSRAGIQHAVDLTLSEPPEPLNRRLEREGQSINDGLRDLQRHLNRR